MYMNLMINDWIDTISNNPYESHVPQFIVISFFTYPSAIRMKEIEKSYKLRVINEKELKKHF